MSTLNEQLTALIAQYTTDGNRLTALIEALKDAPFLGGDATLYVAATGSAAPVNPLAGDAFDSISSAFAWLRGYRLLPTVTVIISVEAGTLSETGDAIDTTHPDGRQIEIWGADLAGEFPDDADFAAAEATDEAMIRARFSTIIECASNGLIISRSGIRLAKNILFVGAETGTGIYAGMTENTDPVTFGGNGSAEVSVMDCWFHNFSSGCAVRSGGQVTFLNVGVSYSASHGILVNDGSYLKGTNVLSRYNTGDGLHVRDSSTAELLGGGHFDNNTGRGIYCQGSKVTASAAVAGDMTARGNTGANLYAKFNGFIHGIEMNLNTNGVSPNSGLAQYGSGILLDNPVAGSGYSPASGATGNVNSWLSIY